MRTSLASALLKSFKYLMWWLGLFFFRRVLEAAMGTYFGVALGEKVPAGGLFEAICDDENERKADLWVW